MFLYQIVEVESKEVQCSQYHEYRDEKPILDQLINTWPDTYVVYTNIYKTYAQQENPGRDSLRRPLEFIAFPLHKLVQQ